MSSKQRQYDIIVFGATGFTDSLTDENVQKLRLAMAGRDASKLAKVKARLTKNWGVVIADVTDDKSLDAMTSNTKALISTTGPFTLYGPQVVRSCIKNSTHYIDSTGEPAYVTEMYKLHEVAQKKKCWIVPACGFDSIPADLTLFASMLKLSREEKANAEVRGKVYSIFGGSVSGGTFGTMVELMTDPSTRTIRTEISRLNGGKIHYFKHQGWAFPLPSSDPFVVDRSHQLLKLPAAANEKQSSPAYYPQNFKSEIYLVIPSFLMLISMGIFMFFAVILSQFALGRRTLKWLIPPGTGPDQQTRNRSFFNTIAEVSVKSGDKSKKITTVMRGGDPGYSETSKMLSECALAFVLEDIHEFDPQRPSAAGEVGGVVSPAVAFGPILMRRLNAAGILINSRVD